MSTNYYAHIIPTKERKQELYAAINRDDFGEIQTLMEEMYGDIGKSYTGEEIKGGIVHLGKASGGWKFCWNPNVYVKRNWHKENGEYISDPDTAVYLYPLTKKGIKAFIDRADVLIYDEYGELQDKQMFWKMALNWGYEKGDEGWDSASYQRDNPREREWSCDTDLTRLLASEGFSFISWTRHDFYSDGLRFNTTTEFC